MGESEVQLAEWKLARMPPEATLGNAERGILRTKELRTNPRRSFARPAGRQAFAATPLGYHASIGIVVLPTLGIASPGKTMEDIPHHKYLEVCKLSLQNIFQVPYLVLPVGHRPCQGPHRLDA